MKPIFSTFHKHILSHILIILLTLSSLTSCNSDKTFEEFTYDLFLDEISSNTINLHYSLEDPDAYGIKSHTISLGDFSKEGRTAAKENLRDTFLALATYPYLTLTTEEKLTFEILEDYLNTQLALSEYELYQEPLSASGGIHMELPILFAEYEFKDEGDVKDYLKLIALTDEYFQDIIDFEKEKSEAGLFMSDSQCQTVIESCISFLERTPSHYLLSTFDDRIKALSLSENKTHSYIEENQQILEEHVFPAYETLISELSSLMGSGKNDLGLCYFPSGKEYYEQLVYAQTGCADTVDDIFSRIDLKRSEDLLACVKLQENRPSVLQECHFLEWEMLDPASMLTLLQDEILEDFPTPPASECRICYVEPSLEEYLAPAFYIVAPLDNYLENTIYINNSYVTEDLYSFTTLAHEGYPGHLYQTVMSYEYDMLPVRSILNYSGYTEGWATYIEMMSYHYANLSEDVAAMFSHNQAATLSLYASSDIGLHYYGWTPSDMYAFWSSYGIYDKDTINEITQLILSEPGNYLKYYVGYLEFLDLRDAVSASLGNNFSLVDFHRTILDIGPAPFPILEKYFWNYYSPQT